MNDIRTLKLLILTGSNIVANFTYTHLAGINFSKFEKHFK